MSNSWHEVEALEPRLMLDAGPIVTAITINDGNAQRSILAGIAVEFDRDVGPSASADDLILTRMDTGMSVDLSGALFSYDPQSMTATWRLTGLPADRIGDGFYNATLVAAGISASGSLLDGNRDGSVGDDYSFGLFRMSGDANGDGVVNMVDLTIVQDNFLKPPGTFQGDADVNADGEVNIFDLRAVRQGWQEKLEPPAPLDRATTVADAAAALYYSPERMFEYVLNNFRYEPYAGQMKGPQATMATRAGNAWDQAALLVGLLDQAGVYSRFVAAQVEADAQAVTDWIGTKDASAAASVLANASLHPTSILNGGQVISIRFDQTWVESYLPDPTGTRQWTDLDPTWKFRDFQPGLAGLITLVPFDEAGYLSQTRKELAYEYYQDQVSAYLAAHMPGTSLADVPYDGPIIPRAIADLSAEALPYGIAGAESHYTQVPTTMTHRVRVWLEDDYGLTTYLDDLLSMPVSSLQRVTISYADAGGGQLRPQLRLDGLVVAQSSVTVASGAGVMLYIDHYDGDGNSVVDNYTSYERSAGEYIAVGLDAGQISQPLLDRIQKVANEAAIARINGLPYEQDDQLGAFLARAAMGYFYEVGRAEKIVAGLTEGVEISNRVASGIVTAGTETNYFPDLTNPYLPPEYNLDVANNVGMILPLNNGDTAGDARRQITDHNNSAQEHAIWEELAQTTGMSTIKSLQLANEGVAPPPDDGTNQVFVITPANFSVIFPQLHLDPQVEQDIQFAVLVNGDTVTVPQYPTPLNYWHGVGYIDASADGSSRAYIIFGGLDLNSAGIQGGSGTDPNPTPVPDVPTGNNPDQAPPVGDPINIANGNVTRDETDLSLPGAGLGLEFSRHYDSQSDLDVGLGAGWAHTYGDFVTYNGDGSITWVNGVGMKFTFASDGGGGFITPPTLHGALTVAPGVCTFRNKDGMEHVFDSSGRLVEIRDRNDNALAMSYADGVLVAVIDADAPARRLTLTYSDGLIASVSDFTGRTWTYGYSSGRLSSVTTPSDGQTPAYTTQYAYYTGAALGGLLQDITQADGGVTHYSYYPDRRGFEVTDPLGNAHCVLYNLYRNRATFVDERGFQTLYDYNDYGNLVREVYPDGAVESWVWANSLMTSHTDPFGKITAYSHDAMGNVTQVVDRAGETSSYTYDPTFSQLTSASLPGGRDTAFTIDADGNITEILDAMGGVTAMTYDPRGLMLTWTSPLGTASAAPGDYTTTYTYNDAGQVLTRVSDLPATESFTYNSGGNLLTATDANGNTTSYTYDLLNRRLTANDAMGGVTSMVYTPLAGPASVTDPLGRTTSFEYDLNALTVRVTAPDHGVTAAVYDGLGNVISRTDPLGRVTQLVYDDRGRLSATVFADAAVQIARYDGAGRLAASVDALGNVTGYAYDAMDRLLGITDALGYVTTMSYDAVGNMLSMTDANGNLTAYAYDLLNRLTTATDALGNVTTTAYDADGNAVSVTDPLGRVMQYAYDVAGRRTTVTDPLGHVTTTGYDPAGNVVSVTDPLGDATTYAYDALNRRVRTIDALGAVTAAAYDAVGNLLSITDPAGNATGYTYDPAGRVQSETDPLGAATRYSYDLAGNRLSKTDRNGRTSGFAYDARDRLTEETWFDGAGSPIRTIDRTYDLAGRMTQVSDPDSTIDYVYDALGRVIEVNEAIAGLQLPAAPEIHTGRLESGDGTLNGDRYLDIYTFTAAIGDHLTVQATSPDINLWLILFRPSGSNLQDSGKKTCQIQTTANEAGTWTVWVSSADSGFPEGDYSLSIDTGQTTSAVVLGYEYDAVGNVTSMSDSLGGANAYVYDAANRLIRETQSGTGVADKRADFAYNPAGQMSTVSRYADLAATLPVAASTYTYDGAARLTGLTHASGGTTITGYGWTFDAADRITQMTSTADGASDFTYDSTDQLTAADHSYQGDEDYAYDANGNRTNTGYATGAGNRLLSDGTYTYEYDAEGNRTLRTDIATGETTEYTWDHRNRLTRVVDKNAGGAVLSDARYTYDAFGRRVSKWVDADGAGPAAAAVETFIYDGAQIALVFDGTSNLTHRYLYGPGIDQVLADDAAGGTVLWALSDHLGTVRDVINSSGTVQNHIQYDSFGQITAQSNPAVAFRFTYTGRELDAETGMYYYRARYYDSSNGQFVNEDPASFASGDTGFYQYCGNSPIMHVDPLGLKPTEPTPWHDAPTYDPGRWNEARIQYSTNCYAYAANDPEGHPRGRPQPGERTGQPITWDWTTSDVAAAAERDGMIHAPGPVNRDGYYLVALVINPSPGEDRDYHWYRQDSSGYWSHKPGWTKATDRDRSGNLITNPEEADRGGYTEFYGYFYVPKEGIPTGPP